MLHYHLFSDIDWNEEFNHFDIVLILCYPVIKELDKHKYSHQDIRIKNRVKKVLAKISELITDEPIASINSNTKLLLLMDSIKIDWIKYNLDSNDADDRILASIISFEADNKILLTSDLGLSLKAKSKDIVCFSISGKYLVKDEQSKPEKELRKLQERIKTLENRIPILNIHLQTDSDDRRIAKFNLNRINEITDNEIDSKIEELKKSLEYKPPRSLSPLDALGALSQLTRPSESEIERYSEEVEKHLQEMRSFYKKKWKYQDIMSRIIELNFILENSGTCPADDVSIIIHFPDGFALLEDLDIINKPNEPDPPSLPRSTMDMLKTSQFHIPTFNSYQAVSNVTPDLVNFNGPTIKKTNSYEVTFHIQRLKQKMSDQLDPFYLYFESFNMVKSFSVDYTIIAANSPEPITGELPLLFNIS